MNRFGIWIVLMLVTIVGLVAFAGEGNNSDAQVVLFLQREGFEDSEIIEFMDLPRFPDIQHGELTPGRQLWIREDRRIAMIFYIVASDTVMQESWTCHQTKVLFDYCGDEK